MATSIISAGDAANLGVQTTGGDDGVLVLRSGAAGAKVDALSIAASGTGAFVGEVTATGFTGTLDGVLGSGTPAAATVTTLAASGDLTANNFAGSRFKSHPSKSCCCTACIQHYAPSSINNSTSFQATRHSDRVLSQESGIAHRTPRKHSLRQVSVSFTGTSLFLLW